MPSSGIIQGLDDTGADSQPIQGPFGLRRNIPLAADKQGKLLVRCVLDEIMETNRLLRKLITGLEQEVGREFLEVE